MRFKPEMVGQDATMCIEPLELKFKKGAIRVKTMIMDKWGVYREFNGILPLDIRRQLTEEGVNWVCIVTGRPRTGKSWSALTLAKAIDPNFTIDNVVFSPEEFIKLIQGAEKNEKLKDGSIILWDEAGVGLSHYSWYSILAKCINLVLQTWGYKHFGLILTVPHFSFIDASTRKMVNCHIKTIQRTEYRGVRARIHYLTPMRLKNQDLIKTIVPRIKIGGWKFMFYFIEFRKPPVKLRNEYEKRKSAFVLKLEASTLAEIIKVKKEAFVSENKLRTDEEIVIELYDSLIQNIKVLDSGKTTLSWYFVKKGIDVGNDRAKAIRDLVLKRFNKEHPDLLRDTLERTPKPKIVPI